MTNKALPSSRIRFGLITTFIGFFVFLVGARPDFFGLDRSPVIGFVQIAVFLLGLAFICLGGYITLTALWNGCQLSIAADIGVRLVSTGYVICVASGMADVFGFGGQPWPAIPFFGRWQAIGVQIGEAMIAIGFVLLIPWLNPTQPPEEAPGGE
ncbi:MAG: hypothetical protein AB1345_10675 [Chloroflexota bacterium]